MCILHNLSYRLDAEVPTRYRQLEYNARNAHTEKSSTGCFSNKSDKTMVSAVGSQSQGPLAAKRPAGLGCLAHPFLSVPHPRKPETSPRGRARARALALGWRCTLGAE